MTTTEDEIPRNLGELFRDPQKVRDAFTLLRQLKNLKVITDDRPITTPKVFPNARDMTIDLRSGTPSGVTIPPLGGPFIPFANNSVIICQTTNSATANAALLTQAYVAAKALLPNGLAISTTNRACVIVMPGKYDFGSSELVIDTQGVDFVGWSTSRRDQEITSTKTVTNAATVRKTVDNVHLANLFITINASTGNSAAWYPTSSFPAERLINCEFDEVSPLFNGTHSMRLDMGYSGYYQDCRAGAYGWGQGTGNNFDGTAVNCINAGEGGFAATAICSGTLFNCQAPTRYGFGGQDGTFSGTAFNCIGGTQSFGGASNGLSSAGTFSGKAYGCTAGSFSFGSGGLVPGITSTARIFGCTMTSMAFAAPAAGAIIIGSLDSTGIVFFPTVGFSSPMTSVGDIIVGGASGVATRLGIGSNGAMAYVSGGTVAWLPPGAAGAILYLNSSLVPTWLAPGFNGATLQLSGGIPTWVGGTPPGDDETDYIGSRVFNYIGRQVFNIGTLYHG